MKQVFILVEGQTEEVIVNNVLAPSARARGFALTPTVVITSATPTGVHRGGGGWRQYDIRLRSLLGASHAHRIGLLIDYYQYPQGAPGYGIGGNGTQRQRDLMHALRTHYPDPRFRPLVVLHEIEALVLAAILDL